MLANTNKLTKQFVKKEPGASNLWCHFLLVFGSVRRAHNWWDHFLISKPRPSSLCVLWSDRPKDIQSNQDPIPWECEPSQPKEVLDLCKWTNMYYLLKCFLSQLNTSKQTNICEYGTHIHILTYLHRHRLTGRQILQISTSYLCHSHRYYFLCLSTGQELELYKVSKSGKDCNEVWCNWNWDAWR